MQNSKNISPDSDLTAFKASQNALRERLASAQIRYDEFQRKLKRCSLSTCRGRCCYDGASVDEQTAAQVEKLVEERRPAFAEMGLNLPEKVIEKSEWNGVVGLKTATRSFPYRSLVKDYPAHFNETACVFLLDDGRCGLQILSEQEGKHRWYYKPFTCWLQPIKLSNDGVRLYDEHSDPNILPNYNGFVVRTHCGRTELDGLPAIEVLKEELMYLGKLLGRDLLSEVEPAPGADEDQRLPVTTESTG
jgi:hypothetical protein